MTATPFGVDARLHHVVDRLAETAADRVVLVDRATALTGGALAGAVADLADRLGALGVRGGDRVVLVGENSAALAAAVFALSRCDAWCVLVNARLTAAELAVIVRHCDARAILYTVSASPAAAGHARDSVCETLDLGAVGTLAVETRAAGAPEPVERDGRRQTAALIYTSGTTGQPKGVMLTHANLLFIAERSGRVRLLNSADRAYGVLPITHVFGLASVFLGTLFYGGQLRLVAQFDAEAVARALAEDGITIFQGVPAMYARLLELARRRGGALPAPALRYISVGGAPLDLTLKRRVEAMWGLPLNNGYGLTESAPTVTTTRSETPAEDDHTGPVLPGVALRIANPETGAEVATGTVGEIRVRGPNVMRGYYRDAAETAKTLTDDGWLKTGDLGRVDAAGNLYVVGRLKELIIRSGFNVYPPEVEAALAAHADVALAAVVGRRVGENEEVIAFLQPVAGHTLDEVDLRRHAEERLAPYKRPSRYVFLAQLPVTAAGKVLKARLLAALGGVATP